MIKLKPCPLGLDPFDGEFGNSEDVTLSDKMVRARKEHRCFWCSEIIKLKELHRYRVDKIDGKICTYRWCADCCTAIIADIKSGTCDATEKRINLNRRTESKEVPDDTK